LKAKDSAAVCSLLEQLWDETTLEKENWSIISNALLVTLLVMLSRFSAKSPEVCAYRRLSETISEIVDYINSHIREELLVGDLSRKFYISRYHLSREFQKHFGTSIHHYVLQRRLQLAGKLLVEGINPTTVAEQCGFQEYTTFYRAFKQEYGIPPVEFTKYAENSMYLDYSTPPKKINISGTGNTRAQAI
jgi:AraC-like DNA-binding protein